MYNPRWNYSMNQLGDYGAWPNHIHLIVISSQGALFAMLNWGLWAANSTRTGLNLFENIVLPQMANRLTEENNLCTPSPFFKKMTECFAYANPISCSSRSTNHIFNLRTRNQVGLRSNRDKKCTHIAAFIAYICLTFRVYKTWFRTKGLIAVKIDVNRPTFHEETWLIKCFKRKVGLRQ